MNRTAPALAVIMLLGGCVTAPQPLRGEFVPIQPAQGAAHIGTLVRWGGTVAAVEPAQDHTCFQVVGRDLADDARPRPTDISNGRFLACREGFYDPAVFAEGREITVIGRIEGVEDREIGAYVYHHPRLDAERIFLWPERLDAVIYAPGYRPWYW